MAKPPAFQWYPKDCDTDENVRMMDDAEFGFYVRCLNHSWMNHGLPTDIGALARIMGKTPRQLVKLWSVVSSCFVENSQKRFINPKQELQRSEQEIYRKKQAEAAKSKWDNKSPMPPHDSGSGQPMPKGWSPSPPASPSENLEENLNNCPSGDGPQPGLFAVTPPPEKKKSPSEILYQKQIVWFEKFWQVYWRREGKKPAFKAFRKSVLTEAHFNRVMAALLDQTTKMLLREVESRPMASTWLNQSRWEDEHSPQSGDSGPRTTSPLIDGRQEMFPVPPERRSV